ncbi:F-box and WD repeat domain containing 5 isoform X2 [Lycorma delicatula]|uniref:F-box and WD repeat domain containing 5 isoform X2 n=1 Tax=Lycorma delicatula TaxID=130591 RepID=UPI003F510AA4
MNIKKSEKEVQEGSSWNYVPDTILLHIFQYLSAKELLDVGLTCQSWNRVSYDEILWKHLLYRDFKIDLSIGIMPNKDSWLGEYKRLSYETPTVCAEVLVNHSHQVLHVSFAHNGTMFATSSKDGYVVVWKSKFPAEEKYHHDMKTFSWQYTQFSQFNQSDTLLLVSGVHFGTPNSTSGEIAVFSLQDGFQLQCRVVNKPYDIFGTWYSDQMLLSGDLYWLAHLVSTTGIWLNKASQETASEHTPIMNQLFRFYNTNASSVRAIMVANCLIPDSSAANPLTTDADEEKRLDTSSSSSFSERGNPPSHRDLDRRSSSSKLSLHDDRPQSQSSVNSDDSVGWEFVAPDGQEFTSSIFYSDDYRQVERERGTSHEDSESEGPSEEIEGGDSETTSDMSVDTEMEDDLARQPEKFLIFTTGSKTYTPHQIGLKRIKRVTFPRILDPGPSLSERIAERRRKRERDRNNIGSNHHPDPDWLNYQAVADRFDTVDHVIDLHGHIIGMGLSPDHRYLYVNSRPWPRGYVIRSPLDPPPIAQEIDIHVIDLVTLQEVGTMLRSHKAYTPNNECFFIFLDVCDEYVASGAEDKHGYLWDRHYGICLAKLPHTDVVNSVAFNPQDSGMLVSCSDDFTIKVWRSRASLDRLVGSSSAKELPKAIPVARRKNKHHSRKCETL